MINFGQSFPQCKL